MKTCRRRLQELEGSLRSFIDSNSERMIKTEEKLETICNRIERLESLSSENNGDSSRIEIIKNQTDENVDVKKQKVE
jgi:hypothetical protein